MDYNILNLIKPDIDFTKVNTGGSEKSQETSLIIKFNIPLNRHMLDSDSVYVTDSQKNIILSTVKYDKTQNAINLITKNEWNEGSNYFLNIGGNIKSLSGHSLSGKVIFRFRIKDGKPTDFLLVSGKTSLGANRVNSNLKKADVQLIEKLPVKKKKDNLKINKHLPYMYNFYIIGMFLIGIIFCILSFILSNNTFFYLAVAALVFWGVYLFIYVLSQKGKSQIQYNLGAFLYNIKRFEKSVYHFEKSIYYDKKNIKSRLAMESAFSQYLCKI